MFIYSYEYTCCDKLFAEVLFLGVRSGIFKISDNDICPSILERSFKLGTTKHGGLTAKKYCIVIIKVIM